MAQVLLPPDGNLEDVRRMLPADLVYIERQGLWLDVRLLVASVAKLLCLPVGLVATLCSLPRA